jgi:hypothetical protein
VTVSKHTGDTNDKSRRVARRPEEFKDTEFHDRILSWLIILAIIMDNSHISRVVCVWDEVHVPGDGRARWQSRSDSFRLCEAV